MNLSPIIARAATTAIASINQLVNIPPPAVSSQSFAVAQIQNPANIGQWIKHLNASTNGSHILYVITVDSASVSASGIETAFQRWKANGGSSVHTSKVNTKNKKPTTPPFTLYVGSKVGRFGTRVSQHIGSVNTTTYALHMKDWLPSGIQSVTFEYYDYGRTITGPQLQFVEDSIWDYLQPMFGKRGAR